MIFDTLAHSGHYRQLHPGLPAAFDYLERLAPATPDGRIDLAGDDVFALIQSYTTVEPAEKRFESHRVYLDLQFQVSGEEIIHYAPRVELAIDAAYDPARDVELYSGLSGVPLLMRPGRFAILFPQDAHKPGCQVRLPEPVRKIVIKIRL